MFFKLRKVPKLREVFGLSVNKTVVLLLGTPVYIINMRSLQDVRKVDAYSTIMIESVRLSAYRYVYRPILGPPKIREAHKMNLLEYRN